MECSNKHKIGFGCYDALLPKKETQADSFLKKYPKFNGEGVTIAIFDSGIDPEAPGLQNTPSGKRKILDLIDCSGSGDVDMKTVVWANENNEVIGKTGRTLKIPQTWINPTGQFRIGVKNLFSIFPSSLKERVKNEKKEKEWDPFHKFKLAEAAKHLSEFEKVCPNRYTEKEKLEHSNLVQAIECLNLLEQKYEYCGPVYDCIMFHDGTNFRACIDTSERGALEECNLLEPFKISGRYARLSDIDMLNYSINVYENGDVLSIVINSSSHGTHVAAIAAAYFEPEHEMNGIAPGAQIISMKIGDGYLNGMETGTALIRAIKEAELNKVDLVNMSYGEATKWANSGRVIEMINKLVDEYGVIFISSAGNNGPALSTTGSPGGTTANVIGVGAYVSTDMMISGYSLLESMPGTAFTWSSRGPCTDGSLGVCIIAPGGAITSVPKCTLSKQMLMNGTSMSSPNACGCVGLLLSALKQKNIKYTPTSIRRCLENSALKIEGLSECTQGHGMIQVEKSYEYIMNNPDNTILNYLSFNIICANNKRGIYIRELKDLSPSLERYTITIQPNFNKNTDKEFQATFSLKVSLLSTQSWVSCPSNIYLCNVAREVVILVKTSSLSPGYHYAEVQGFSEENSKIGPVIRVPITVIVPESFEGSIINKDAILFNSQVVHRWFYCVPKEVNWVSLALSTKAESIKYVVHAVQLIDEEAFSETQFHKQLILKADAAKTILHFKVRGGYTMELCLARWWMVNGASDLSFELGFHSLNPDNSVIQILPGDIFSLVNVSNSLAMEEIGPSGSLTHHVIPMVPTDAVLTPLGTRDRLFNGEQSYTLLLKYSFSLEAKSTVSVFSPLLSDMLYESQYESEEWALYDSNKQLCYVGGSLPVKNNYQVNLPKGNYNLNYQVRNNSMKMLEDLKKMVLNLKIQLSVPIELGFFSSRKKFGTKENPTVFAPIHLKRHSNTPVYICALSTEKYSESMKPGHYLTGTVSYSKDPAVKKVVTYPISVMISEKSKCKEENVKKEIEKEYEEANEDFQCTWIAKLNDSLLQKTIVENLSKDVSCNTFLSSKNALLNSLDQSKNRGSNLLEIINLCKEILSVIDQQKILSYFSMKTDPDIDAAQRKQEMEKQKLYTTNALYKMGLAVADSLQAVGEADRSLPTYEVDTLVSDLDLCYHDLMKFVDSKDKGLLLLTVRHGIQHKHYGRSLNAILKFSEEYTATKAEFETIIRLAEFLSWEHVALHLRTQLLIKFPETHHPF